ncbi:MAG: hypothetical protein HYZ28_01370 [Myxococcales bacterium]|nr:hypothetical protein [Myxococcales bacterium]
MKARWLLPALLCAGCPETREPGLPDATLGALIVEEPVPRATDAAVKLPGAAAEQPDAGMEEPGAGPLSGGLPDGGSEGAATEPADAGQAKPAPPPPPAPRTIKRPPHKPARAPAAADAGLKPAGRAGELAAALKSAQAKLADCAKLGSPKAESCYCELVCAVHFSAHAEEKPSWVEHPRVGDVGFEVLVRPDGSAEKCTLLVKTTSKTLRCRE